jgi:hypothetical protein
VESENESDEFINKTHKPSRKELSTTHKGRPSKFFDLPVNGKPNAE